MKSPKIDLTKPEAVMKEIIDDDRWVKDEFGKQRKPGLLHGQSGMGHEVTRLPNSAAHTWLTSPGV